MILELEYLSNQQQDRTALPRANSYGRSVPQNQAPKPQGPAMCAGNRYLVHEKNISPNQEVLNNIFKED